MQGLVWALIHAIIINLSTKDETKFLTSSHKSLDQRICEAKFDLAKQIIFSKVFW